MRDWRAAIVRIFEGDPRIGSTTFLGSAFLVGQKQLLSCRHVVDAKTETTIFVAGSAWTGPQTITSCRFHESRDIAVLAVSDDLDCISSPLELWVRKPGVRVSDLTITLAGFSTATGSIETPQVSLRGYDGLLDTWVLHTHISKGLSGGPALIDGRVVGVTQAREAEGGKTYIIPITAIRDFLRGNQILAAEPASIAQSHRENLSPKTSLGQVAPYRLDEAAERRSTLTLRIRRDEQNRFRISVATEGADSVPARVDFQQSFAAIQRELQTRSVSVLPEKRTHLLEAIKDIGSKLFDLLFHRESLSLFERGRREAQRYGRLFEIKLSVDDQALENVPWETLYDVQFGQHLCLDRSLRFVRTVPGSRARRRATSKAGPIEVLCFVGASREIDRDAVALPTRGAERLRFSWLPSASASDLATEIGSGTWDILYFRGGVGFDAEADEPFIVVQEPGDQNRVKKLYASDLCALLVIPNPPELVVLLTGGEAAPAASPSVQIAEKLVSAGIPAAIAMQFGLDDSSAIHFAEHFFSNLAAGHSVSDALTIARIKLKRLGRGDEWAAPVLYIADEQAI